MKEPAEHCTTAESNAGASRRLSSAATSAELFQRARAILAPGKHGSHDVRAGGTRAGTPH